MLQDLIEGILETLGEYGGDFLGDGLDSLLDSLSAAGIDLTNYTADEINAALDIALNSDDNLGVSDGDVTALQEKAGGVERSGNGYNPSFEAKMCPTRHGCAGATACDRNYGSYPG